MVATRFRCGLRPVGTIRLALSLRHPGAAWTLRDVRGVLKLLALLSTLALIPALVWVPFTTAPWRSACEGDARAGKLGPPIAVVLLAVVLIVQRWLLCICL